MTQTLGAMNTVNGKIEVAATETGGVPDWADISGSANKLVPTPQTADTGEAASLDGQYKIVTAGKFNPLELAITALYTETAAEAYAVLKQAAAVAGRKLWVRWSPAGGNPGDARFTTASASGAVAPGVITSMPFPGADAETAGPTLLDFTVKCTTVVEDAVPAP